MDSKGKTVNSSTRHFVRIIRAKRLSKGLSILSTALLCDMSFKGYEKIELGDSDPKLSSVIKIAKALEINLGELNSLCDD